jgi:hypothetical protein
VPRKTDIKWSDLDYASKRPSKTHPGKRSSHPTNEDRAQTFPIKTPSIIDQRAEDKHKRDGPSPEIRRTDVASPSPISSPQPPDRSPQSPPQSICYSTIKWNGKSPRPSIPDHYDCENPSIFEQYVEEVVSGSQLPPKRCKGKGKMIAVSPDSPIIQGPGDPVKIQPRPSSKLAGSVVTASSRSNKTSKTGTTAIREQPKPRDNDVLRDLENATAAPPDQKVDAWMEELPEPTVRKSLADLKGFEGLGVNELAEQAMKTARRRSKESNTTTRNAEQIALPDTPDRQLNEQPKGRDRRMGLVAADDREGLAAEMLRRREARAAEGIKERAEQMGWRVRSVSAGQ